MTMTGKCGNGDQASSTYIDGKEGTEHLSIVYGNRITNISSIERNEKVQDNTTAAPHRGCRRVGNSQPKHSRSGLRLAASALYVTATAATTATVAAGATAGVAGTGYLAVQGGRLVLTAARPGLIGSIRAANMVARDIRSGVASTAGGAIRRAGRVQQAVSQGASEALSAGTAAGGIIVNLGAEGAAQLAGVYPDFPALFNRAVQGRAQREVPVRILIRDSASFGDEGSLIVDIVDGAPLVVADGVEAEGDLVELHLMTPALGHEAPAVEGSESTVGQSVKGHGGARSEVDFEQDIVDAVLEPDPDLADVDWASEVVSFQTTNS
ncbi:hypothetical protein GQ53DRAFT_758384 [Thozetella sp. PMI_491]|nr:hypothetical protein GQ53DRAFT_758384 [Thozetella sp. PMI_491]